MTQYVKFRIPKLIPLRTNEDRDDSRLINNIRSTTTEWVTKEVFGWARRENIEDYKIHALAHAVYLEFKHPAQITQFMLTWNPHPGVNATSWKRISIVETLENVESN